MRIWKIRRYLILSFLLIYSLSNFNMISLAFAAGNKSNGQFKSNVTTTTKMKSMEIGNLQLRQLQTIQYHHQKQLKQQR